MNRTLFSAVACIALFAACTKKANKTTTSCTSHVYGFSGTFPSSLGFMVPTTQNFGQISLAAASISGISSFQGSIYSNQGAFDTADGHYYLFKIKNSSYTDTLYQIGLTGGVNALTSATTEDQNALVYSRFSNKLYSIKGIPSGGIKVAQVTPGGSTFTTSVVASLAVPSLSPTYSSTVDNQTGTVYIPTMTISGSSADYSIYRYNPPAAAPVLLCSGTNAEIVGLCFNGYDHKLYAMRCGSTNEFIRIDPASGTVTSLATVSFLPNKEFSSACVDDCTGNYIISTITSGSSSATPYTMYQFNNTGTLLQTNSLTTMYQGLTVKYN